MNIKKLNEELKKFLQETNTCKYIEDVSSVYLKNLDKIEKAAKEQLLPQIKSLGKKINKGAGLNKCNFEDVQIQMMDSFMAISNVILIESFSGEILDSNAVSHQKNLKKHRTQLLKEVVESWITSLHLKNVSTEIYADDGFIDVEFSGEGLYQ